MEQRVSLISLGVADIAESRAFYERLGWQANAASSNESIVFFELGGVLLGLYGRSALAEDAQVPDSESGFSGVALAHNVRSRAAVEATLEEARRAGARILKPAQEVFWGGYSGYFADPDGHLWEIAYNPFAPLDDEGRMQLGGGGTEA